MNLKKPLKTPEIDMIILFYNLCMISNFAPSNLKLESHYERINVRKFDFQDDIVTVNEIYKRMADIVEDQGDMVTSIEFNIENTSVQVTEGTEQLRQAETFKVSFVFAISFCTSVVLCRAELIYLQILFLPVSRRLRKFRAPS